MSKKNNPGVLALAVSVLPMADIVKLSIKEACARYADRAAVSQRAFAEMGKLHHAIQSSLTTGQTIYGELRKLGVKDSTISNASYASRVWGELVAPGHLTEVQFDTFTFADCLTLCRVTGKMSKRRLTGAEVSALLTNAPGNWDAELESIYETGLTVEEVTAQADKKKADDDAAAAQAQADRDKAIADKAAADAIAKAASGIVATNVTTGSTTTDAPTEESEKVESDAPQASDETEAPAPPAPAETPAPTETPAPPVETPAPVPAETPAPVETPVPQSTVPTNVVQMPTAQADPDMGVPAWKSAVEELFTMLATFSTAAQVDCATHFAEKYDAYKAAFESAQAPEAPAAQVKSGRRQRQAA